MVDPLYISAVKTLVQDAFSKSKVSVWTEDSVFYPGMMEVKVRVDNCGAYVTLNKLEKVSEECIAGVLIEKIREVLDG